MKRFFADPRRRAIVVTIGFCLQLVVFAVQLNLFLAAIAHRLPEHQVRELALGLMVIHWTVWLINTRLNRF